MVSLPSLLSLACVPRTPTDKLTDDATPLLGVPGTLQVPEQATSNAAEFAPGGSQCTPNDKSAVRDAVTFLLRDTRGAHASSGRLPQLVDRSIERKPGWIRHVPSFERHGRSALRRRPPKRIAEPVFPSEEP